MNDTPIYRYGFAWRMYCAGYGEGRNQQEARADFKNRRPAHVPVDCEIINTCTPVTKVNQSHE